MKAEHILQLQVEKALKDLYGLSAQSISFQKTRKEFEGDFTLVTFGFTKAAAKSPEQLGQELGTFLQKNCPEVARFNVVKGFLNLSLPRNSGFLIWIVLALPKKLVLSPRTLRVGR